MAEDRIPLEAVILDTPGTRHPATPGIQQINGHLIDERHTDVLTATWMPNRLQHEHEVLYELSCNNSETIIDTTISMTPWTIWGGFLLGDPGALGYQRATV